MCLAVPARIMAVYEGSALVDLDGVRLTISTILCPEAEIGDYALIHAGFAIALIDEQAARVSMDAFAELRSCVDV